MPEFIAEAEQQLLGAALKQWHGSAEGVVASSILEVRVIEQRLLHAVYRYAPHMGSCDPLCTTCCEVKCDLDWVYGLLLQAGAAQKLRWQHPAGTA